jgi:hypothetical protein
MTGGFGTAPSIVQILQSLGVMETPVLPGPDIDQDRLQRERLMKSSSGRIKLIREVTGTGPPGGSYAQLLQCSTKGGLLLILRRLI